MPAVVVRIIAFFVVAVISGLPVAGVLCAHECAAVEHAAVEGDAQCHYAEANDGATVRGQVPDGCDPFGPIETARERPSAPFKDAPMISAAPLFRDLLISDSGSRSCARPVAAPTGGLPPGTQVPLRI